MSYCKRDGMFETNSSSTHAVAVKGGDYHVDDGLAPDGAGVVRVYPGEFGWGPENCYDARTKASYLLTWCKETGNDFALSLLGAVIKRETGASAVEFCPMGGFYKWGYIDHQSLEDNDNPGAEVFGGGDESVKNFVFNRKSLLVIDNDNY